MFPRIRLPPLERGLVRYLILQTLSEKPLHGYKIMKNIGEEFGGIRRPSPGAIYPTLQSLEEEGYIKGEGSQGRKVYSITSQGAKYIQKHQEEIKAIVEKRKSFLNERRRLNHELRNLVSLIMNNYHDLEGRRSEEISKIIKEARRKISDTIYE